MAQLSEARHAALLTPHDKDYNPMPLLQEQALPLLPPRYLPPLPPLPPLYPVDGSGGQGLLS
jgi:hypothetical protein